MKGGKKKLRKLKKKEGKGLKNIFKKKGGERP